MEGTYRSIYKKNAQRDGCLLSNLRFTVGYTNLLPERRRLSSPLLQSSRFSVISGFDPESETRRETPWKFSKGKSLARAFKIGTINQTGELLRRASPEEALKKRLCMRFYRLHTPLSYLSATSHEDRNAQTNFRNGPHGRWKYSLPSATIQAHLSTRINDPFFRLADIRKIFRKGHAHVYTHTQVHARIRIHFDTSAQCILAITDYSNTENVYTTPAI